MVQLLVINIVLLMAVRCWLSWLQLHCLVLFVQFLNFHVSPLSPPMWHQSRIYMLEQEKKQADLEISRKELEFHQQEKMIQQLEQRLNEERKRKRRTGRKVRGLIQFTLVGMCW